MAFLQHLSPTDEKSLWAERPATVKPELEKRYSTRPVSASRYFPASKSGSLHKMKRPLYPDPATLSKLKPRRIAIDKERLYEETLALKMESNFFKEENTRLRTKMLHMEREIDRKDGFLEDLKSTSKERSFNSSFQSSHLIASLKTSIKELRQELRAKEEETLKAKRDVRISRLNELEVELQAYIDECTRLRHHLEEVMERMSTGTSTDLTGVEELVQKLSEERKAIEAELSACRQALTTAQQRTGALEKELKAAQSEQGETKAELEKAREETRKATAGETQLKAELAKFQQRTSDLTHQNKALEEEVQRLKLKSGKKVKPLVLAEEQKSEVYVPKVLSPVDFLERCGTAISGLAAGKKQAIKDVLNAQAIAAEALLKALKEAGVDTNAAEVQAAMEQPAVMQNLKSLVEPQLTPPLNSHQPSGAGTFRVKDDVEDSVAPYIPEEKGQSASNSLSIVQAAGPVDKEALAGILKALGFRLQLHRIAKNKLGSTLFGKNFDANETVQVEQLDKILRSPPFNITSLEESALVARFALEPDTGKASEPRIRDVIGKLFCVLEDWEVFSTTDESEFDKHISYLMTRAKDQFQALCQSRDANNHGFIDMKDLREISAELDFDFDEREFHYMELLFFSLNFQLNQVPYRKLLQAYATEDSLQDSTDRSGKGKTDSDSVPESERNTVVRGFMELIASELVRKSFKVRQVFRSKEGILYPDKLVAGMRALGIPDMEEREMVVFLEALQCEELDEYGIEMPLFEDILKGYGGEQKAKESESGSESPGHQLEHSF